MQFIFLFSGAIEGDPIRTWTPSRWRSELAFPVWEFRFVSPGSAHLGLQGPSGPWRHSPPSGLQSFFVPKSNHLTSARSMEHLYSEPENRVSSKWKQTKTRSVSVVFQFVSWKQNQKKTFVSVFRTYTVKAPSFDRVFMKNIFLLHIFGMWPPLKKIHRACKIKVFVVPKFKFLSWGS